VNEQDERLCHHLFGPLPFCDMKTQQTTMYFSRAKYFQFKRTLLLLCPICILLYLFFQAQTRGKLCSSASTRLRPLSTISRDGPLTQLLRDYFCAPAGQHAAVDTEWNLFYHLGGNGPWIQKVDGVIHDTLAPPGGCVVDQAHMVKSFPFP
jgi:hypothetical protein